MATVLKMPRQGQSVESCILTQWYVNPGDKVSGGDLLYAYETDKSAFEEEAPVDGFLLARFYEAGDEVPVLQNVAVIGESGEPFEEFRPESDPVTEKQEEGPAIETNQADQADPVLQSLPDQAVQSVPDQKLLSVPDHPDNRGRITISPRARRLAREKRIVIDSIRGSGPGGRIIERDIEEAVRLGKRLTPLAQKKLLVEGLSVPVTGKAPYGKIGAMDLSEPVTGQDLLIPGTATGSFSDEPLSNVRRIIAGAMHRSLQNSAQLTHHLSANATAMMRLRKEVKSRITEGYAFNITLNDMVCYATVEALKKHPGANAHFLGESIRKFHQVNLGIAVDTQRGLMVPAVADAGNLSLPELSVQLKEVAEQCSRGSISPDLLSPLAASFTVSNLGGYGVEMFTPIINLPQVAILGVNNIIHRPVELPDGTFGTQPCMGLSLTYDHRAMDGGPATLFLVEIKNEIEKLSSELL